MADGFIVRKGGVAGTAAPSINFVSKTFDSITFTITNNDALTADIFWEIGDSTPDANTFTLASGATSSNQVASGLDAEETYTIFAFANAEGKAGSQTTSQVRTTPAEPIVFTAATGGTTLEYDDGGKRYKSHTFLEDGNFVVTTVGDNVDDRNKVDYLIIAGGGSGGSGNQFNPGGGAGAGGYRTTLGTSGRGSLARDKVTVTATTFAVVVGAGGTVITALEQNGNNGTASSALGVSTVGGGGGGGALKNTPSGGSGGGGSAANLQNNGGGVSGTGTTNEGFDGGIGFYTNFENRSGAGGGGAGANGTNAVPQIGGNGGNGLSNTLRNGTSETRAGGGGGAALTNQTAGSGGLGGGGAGVSGTGTPTAGTVNTGSGAGGTVGSTSAAGGSGIVVIRYEIATV